MSENIIEVRGLKTYFHTDDGVIKAVDDVSFHVGRGETLGIVGESGCGKSVTSLSIMQLISRPRGKIESGSIVYYGDEKPVDIVSLDPRGEEMRGIRGNEISMIFQEPMTSLNPVHTVGEQIVEAVLLHRDVSKAEARERAIEMLKLVGIPAPLQRVDEYPHQLSGGMRQRVMIGMSLSCDPVFLIADEPTTALDVTIEAQILELMRNLQSTFNMSIMIITHDLGVIGEMAERVVVMYTGKVMEEADTDSLFYTPKHPYTQGLLKSIPQIGLKNRLVPIEGSVPNLLTLPKGCYFAPRCPKAMDRCWVTEPPTYVVGEGHTAKCWLYEDSPEAVS
jgi:oligopeptide/dipeptide ABC transporter ATP-binding protein